MTFDVVITESHVVLPSGIVEKNIVIDDGKIVDLTNEVPQCDVKINARGLVSMPGVIDPHVHYGVYSPIEKAAVTESQVAAIGGVTTMMRMLRLSGSYKKLLGSHLSESSRHHYIDYAIHASILQKNQINEMEFCAKKGITSFKLYMNLGDDMEYVYMDMEPGTNQLHEEKVEINLEMIEQIITAAATLGCPVLVHAEDYQMCSCGIREAREKKNGTKIYVETCPHYLTLSFESQKGYLAKVMPPIRSLKDVEGIWKELQTGTIDSIGTDHVANQLKLKLSGNNVWEVLAGFPGIGTMLPILMSHGVNKGRMTLQQLAEVTSLKAAKIFGMFPKKGILQKGSDADIVIVDTKKENKVTSQLLDGFSDYTVYEGWNLKGWPVKTLVRGEIVAEDFKIIGKQGYGEFIARPV